MSGPVSSHTALPAAASRHWFSLFELGVLGAIWGCSFLFMRVAAPVFGAYALVAIRLTLGAAVLMPFLWLVRAQFPLRRWPMLVCIGLINSAIPALLFAWAAQQAPAAIGAITNAMAVLFTALVGFVAFGQRISRQRALALLIGFVGVLVLTTGKAAGMSVGPAALAGAFAALLYGIGYNLVQRYMADLPSAGAAAATLGVGALLLTPLAIIHWPQVEVTPRVWASALMLGVLCTGIAYLLYYRLIKRLGPARASTVTYLIPVFGSVLGWLVLDEPLTLTMLLSAALILGSVALSQRGR